MQEIKNILIVKLGAIGDVIMALPMLDAIKEKYPSAKVTWLCGKTVRQLICYFNKEIEIIEVNERKLFSKNIFARLSEILYVWKALFLRKYDLVLIGYRNRFYKILALTTLSTEKRNFGKLDNRHIPVPGKRHSDEYVRLVDKTDGPDKRIATLPKINFPNKEEIRKKFGLDDRPIIAFAPGGTTNLLRTDTLRRWPIENYSELSTFLPKDKFNVIIVGSDSDTWVNKYFSNNNIINLIGKTSLIDLLEVFSICELVITHDSGPMHLANLAGAKVIAVFGPTNPAEKVIPVGIENNNLLLNVNVIWSGENLSCRPCYDGKNYFNCTNNLCMKLTTVEMVYNKILQILCDRIEF